MQICEVLMFAAILVIRLIFDRLIMFDLSELM